MMGKKKLSEIKAQLGLPPSTPGKSPVPRGGKGAKGDSNGITETLESLLTELKREVKKREVRKRQNPKVRRPVKR